MSNQEFSTAPSTQEPDSYSIACEGPNCLYVLRYRGTYVDEGYSYGEVEAYRLLHAALVEAKMVTPHPPMYVSYGGAGLAMVEEERRGRHVRPVYCAACQGWHLVEGR
jgi:hypothetical protein